MALYKVTIKSINISTGIIEAENKDVITEELAKKNHPQWWSQHQSTTDSLTATEIVELEEKSE